jgi:hypothetical protein
VNQKRAKDAKPGDKKLPTAGDEVVNSSSGTTFEIDAAAKRNQGKQEKPAQVEEQEDEVYHGWESFLPQPYSKDVKDGEPTPEGVEDFEWPAEDMVDHPDNTPLYGKKGEEPPEIQEMLKDTDGNEWVKGLRDVPVEEENGVKTSSNAQPVSSSASTTTTKKANAPSSPPSAPAPPSDPPSAASSAPPSGNSSDNGGNGNGSKDPTKMIVPDDYSQVLALPITRRPLFPGKFHTF